MGRRYPKLKITETSVDGEYKKHRFLIERLLATNTYRIVVYAQDGAPLYKKIDEFDSVEDALQQAIKNVML